MDTTEQSKSTQSPLALKDDYLKSQLEQTFVIRETVVIKKTFVIKQTLVMRELRMEIEKEFMDYADEWKRGIYELF